MTRYVRRLCHVLELSRVYRVRLEEEERCGRKKLVVKADQSSFEY
jgi:hypothetical protein